MNAVNSEQWTIHALLNRYTDAVNQRDWEVYRDCWTQDAIWELHPPINGYYEGVESIMKEAKRAVESQELFVQMIHATTILRLDETTAQARVTLNEIGKADPNGSGALPGVGGMFLLAYYTDDLVKQNGDWKFRRRVYDVVYADFSTPVGDVFPLKKESEMAKRRNTGGQD